MKLFTKEIDQKLFDQYMMGSDLENQMVVAKIFNPYGNGVWYLLNSDPSDPDYLWAIVDLFDVELGSVSREELETLKVPPFRLGLERDLYFTPMNAKMLYESLLKGEKFEDGGTIDIIKDKSGESWVFPNDPQGETYGIKLAAGGMTAGRWYKDNSGQELRYIGESQGKLLFNDGEKMVTKSEEDFEDSPKEKKLFGFFADGGRTKGKRYKVNVYYGGEMEDEEFYTDSLDEAERASQGGEHSEIYDNEKKEFVEIEYAEGGMMEHGLRIGDKVTTDMFWDNKIVVENQKTHKRAEIDLENGNRKDEMAKGGVIKYQGKEGKIINKKNGMYFVEVKNYYPNGDSLHSVLRDGEFEKMADGGKLSNGKYKYEKGDEGMFQGDEVRVVKYTTSFGGSYEYNIIDENGKVKTHGVAKAEKFENQFRFFPKMAKGGGVGFTAYGETKGIYKVYYKAEGKPQTEIWETKEMAVSAAKRYSSPKMAEEYSNVKVFDEDGSEVDYMTEYGKGGDTVNLDPKNLIGKSIDDGKIISIDDLGNDNFWVIREHWSGLVTEQGFTKDDLIKLSKGEKVEGLQMMAKGGELMKHKHNESITIELIEPTSKGWKVKQIETHSTRGRKLSTPKEKVAYFSKEEIKDLFEPTMAKGGTTKFKDKVQSIKASLLKRKKVSPKVQKDYGKTYSPKEAEESAKRIAGSMVKKEKRQPRVSKMLEKMKKGTQINKKKSTFKDRMKELSTKIKERKSKTTK